MRILFIFVLFVGFSYVNAQESRKEAEDCQGFNQLAKNIEALGKAYKIADNCRAFSNCSGLQCSGSAFSFPFQISMGLQHCRNPVTVWAHFAVPRMNINEFWILRNGVKVDLFQNIQTGQPWVSAVSGNVVPKLERKNGNITMGGRVCVKVTSIFPLKEQCRNVREISIPLSKKMCSLDGKPSRRSPTGQPKTTTMRIVTKGEKKKDTSTSDGSDVTKPTFAPTLPTKRSVRTMTGRAPDKKSHTGDVHTGRRRPARTSTASIPSKSHQHNGKPKAQGHKGNGGLTTGTKVALVASILLVALLLLGLFAYWRKLKRRRPAYYNDINVNREDEDPFFDSHLVL